MIAARGPTLIELDRCASEPEKPYGIITVDGTNPHEYDDGIAVTELPWQGIYRVSVFAVDASTLYADHDIVKQAIERTESRSDIARGGPKYRPMLDEATIRRNEFKAGTVRNALVVSFIVGESQPPSEVTIDYGKVEIFRNYNYTKFGNKCNSETEFQRFIRAASLIQGHLGAGLSEEEDVPNSSAPGPIGEASRRGSDINETFMVAANHLVGRTMRDEGRLTIFRTHGSDDTTFAEILGPSVARFSTVPNPHAGLGLDVYTRITSPLRRVEDLIMHGILKARSSGRDLTAHDQRLVASTVQRLNQRIAAQQYKAGPRSQMQDLWVPRLAESLAS